MQLTLDEWLLMTAMAEPGSITTLGDVLDALAPVPLTAKRRGAAMNRQAALGRVFEQLRRRGLVVDAPPPRNEHRACYRLSHAGIQVLAECERTW